MNPRIGSTTARPAPPYREGQPDDGPFADAPGLVAALVAGGTGAAALSDGNGLLETTAPLSGDLWRHTGSVPDTVESRYGDAAITYDDAGVPHVEADHDGPLAAKNASVAAVRADDTRRRVALAAAVVVGLGLATVHWVGLVVAGALVGLTRRSLPRALLAGFGFGVLVLVAFVVLTPVPALDALDTLRPASYLTVGLALLAPTWGALLRGAL